MTPLDRQKLRRKRENHSNGQKRRWSDPEKRAALMATRAEACRKGWEGEKGERRRAALAEKNRSAKMRAAASARMTRLNNEDQEWIAQRDARIHTWRHKPEIVAVLNARAAETAREVHRKRRLRRDVVPDGFMRMYYKLRKHGVTRAEALRQCWLAAGEAAE